MIKTKLNQSGVAHVLLILVFLFVAGAIGFAAFRVLQTKEPATTPSTSVEKAKTSGVTIKSLPIELDYYDPTTNKAGDILFTKDKFAEGAMQMLFSEYGYVVPANSANGGQAKSNPQPTFIVPLGTKVRALIDGVVVSIPKLYSNDYSVHMQGEGSDLVFETEHVINVKVKVGDKLKAGDIIAEVSDYDARNYNGLGLVEMGILKGGNPPHHVCPFDYLDDSIKAETLKKITALTTSWESYRGDTTIYDEAKVVTPGCLTRDPIEG